MRTLAIEYSRFLGRSGGRPPVSETDFRNYITTQGRFFLTERGVANVDDLFVSPRDGQPLVVEYGTQKLVPDHTMDSIVAHEQTGVNGKRLAAFANGAVSELDPEVFDQLQLANGAESKPVEDTAAKSQP